MKKQATFLLALLLLAAGVTAYATDITLTENSPMPDNLRTLADEEILRRASEYGMLGFTLGDSYEVKEYLLQDADKREAHIAVYFHNGVEYTGSAYLDADGTVIASHFGPLEALIDEAEQARGASLSAWPLEEQAIFDALYLHSPDRTLRHALPTDTDIPLSEAVDLAKGHLEDAGLATPEDAAAYMVENSYYIGLRHADDKGPDEGKWVVRFLENGMLRYQVTLSAADGTLYDVYDYADDAA